MKQTQGAVQVPDLLPAPPVNRAKGLVSARKGSLRVSGINPAAAGKAGSQMRQEDRDMTNRKLGWPTYDPDKRYIVHVSLSAREMEQIDAYRRERNGPLISRGAAVRELLHTTFKVRHEGANQGKLISASSTGHSERGVDGKHRAEGVRPPGLSGGS